VNARELHITYLSPARFAAFPQVGIPIAQERYSFWRWLTWPTFGTTKQDAGAWCPCALPRGAVKSGRGPISFIVLDVDDASAGAIDRSAALLSPHSGVVVPTFSATVEIPKHRIVLEPSRDITADEFSIVWGHVSGLLAEAGVIIDRGCKNLNRLYFACVSPSLERWAELGGARILTGKPVDVDVMLEAARADLADAAAREARRPKPRPVEDGHRDAYLRGAVEKARANVYAASPGGRHDVLLREAFSLARLDLTIGQIEGALLGAFVHVAGEPRRREGTKAIHDAVTARRRGAA
jgi:hypothetical protein